MEGICTVSGIRLKTDCLEEKDHDDRKNYDSKHNNIFFDLIHHFINLLYNLIFFLPRMKIIVPAAAMIRTAATVLTQYSLPRSGFPLL